MTPLVFSTINGIVRLAAIIGAAPYIAPKLKLYTNNFTPTKDSLLADFTEATFGGYVEATITWGDVGLDQTQVPVAPGPFVFTGDGVTGEQVYGCYLLGSTGLLICACKFADGPYNFGVAGDQLSGIFLFGENKGGVTVAVGP